MTRRNRGSPGLMPWEGHAGRGARGRNSRAAHRGGGGWQPRSPPRHCARWRTGSGRGQSPPDRLRSLGKEGFPPPASPFSPAPAALPAGLPTPMAGRRCAPGLSSARAALGAIAPQRSRLRPELGRAAPPAPGPSRGVGGGGRPARGRGRQCERGWAREGLPRLLGGSPGGGPSREEPYKERIR